MGILIRKQTTGRAKLTKPIKKIFSEWRLDFQTVASMTSEEHQLETVKEIRLLDKILSANELTILDVEQLICLVESNINNSQIPQPIIEQLNQIYGDNHFSNSLSAINDEAKIVKKFIDKHFLIEAQL